MAANAARQAIEDETQAHVRLKWPNDLVLETGKLGGILVESKIQKDQVKFAVLGIGLNVDQKRSQLPLGATSIFQSTGVRFDKRSLLTSILYQIRSHYASIRHPKSLVKEWWINCIHRPLTVQITSHEENFTGITRGIDETGALTVETEDRRMVRVSDGSLRIMN